MKPRKIISIFCIILMITPIFHVYGQDLTKNSIISDKYSLQLTDKKNALVNSEFNTSDLSIKIENHLNSNSTIETTATENTDPNNAYLINLDNVYQGYINENQQQRWYYLNLTDPGKLTVYMQTVNNANVDYDLHIFHLNTSTGSLENQFTSNYGPTMNEQLSYIVEPGYYFICINSYNGFDTANPFLFITNFSTQYDLAEPDDNINYAPVKEGTNLQLTQSIDNDFDVDWIQVNMTTNATVYLALNNVPQDKTYKMDIFDNNLKGLGTLEQNKSYNLALTEGNYFFRIRSENGSGSDYTFVLNSINNDIKDVYGVSPNLDYILYTTANNELYVNNHKITVNSELQWERRYYFEYGGDYTQRTQSVKGGIDKIVGVGQYGSYTSTHYGTIDHGFRIPVSNVLYMYHYSKYQSGVPTEYESTFFDVTGMKTPRWTDVYDDQEFGSLYLIVNADTGELVDLDALLNFYYYYNYENRSFSQIQ